MELGQVFQEVSGQVSRNGRPFAVRGGKIKGDEIGFTIDGDPAARTSPLMFTGRIRGNTIDGAMIAGTSRQTWRATRHPATMQRIDR
jgi:hypothetical protein